MGDTKVAEIGDFGGKQICNVESNLPFSFGLQHSPTGGLESVTLMDDAHEIVEAYEAHDGRLIPIAGQKWDDARESIKEFSAFADAVANNKESPTQIKVRMW